MVAGNSFPASADRADRSSHPQRPRHEGTARIDVFIVRTLISPYLPLGGKKFPTYTSLVIQIETVNKNDF